MPPKFGHNQETGNQTAWRVRESVIVPAGNIDDRVDFDPALFQRVLEQKGINVCVYRTSYCPKVKSVDGAEHDISCNLCNGSGWLDLYPIKTRAFIQNQDLEKQDHVSGIVDGNHVTMTFPAGIELQYFTLVELCDFTDIYIQRVLRQPFADSTTDILRYTAKRVNFITDYSGNNYFQDQDFKIDQNGDIRWLAVADYPQARKPADNTVYTIHYERLIQFRATRAMHVNRFTQVLLNDKQAEHLKLPEQWLLAKDYLVRRKDKNGADLILGPFDNHTEVVDS